MKLANLLDQKLILLDKNILTLDEAVTLGVAAIPVQQLQSLRSEDVLQKVRERQVLGGTIFPTGIAIPHARLAGFDDILIVAIRPKSPIVEEGSNSIYVVWLVLTSQAASSTYLKVLANLAKLSKDEQTMKSLLSAESPARFHDTLLRSPYEVEKGLHVSDIMTRELTTILDTASLRELADLMFSKKLRYLPVVDANGLLVGEVGVLDLISAGIPDYVYRVGSLNFLDEFEPMEELLKNEDTIQVKNIMKPPVCSIAPDSSVLAVAFEMTRSKKRHFPVVEDDRLVGVVSSMDILAKVLRA